LKSKSRPHILQRTQMHLNDSLNIHFTTFISFYPPWHFKEIKKKNAEPVHFTLKNQRSLNIRVWLSVVNAVQKVDMKNFQSKVTLFCQH